jgi:hypothetical protein
MSSVSRSVYQKKCEECKRLLEDIRILVIGPDVKKWAAVTNKWREHYRKSKIKQQHEK